MAEDDAELMLRYARGDLQAFATLYERHRGPLYRYLARQARDREAANDLFQEVWSKVIAHRLQYEPRAKFSTFLFRIAHNCFIDHHRRAAARGAQSAPADELTPEELPDALCAPDHDAPDARAERAELLARYRVALAELPQEQRDAFLLYQQSGLTLEEIAAITGVGAETVKSRLRYALSKLRARLSAASGGEAARGGAEGAAGSLLAQESGS